MVTVACMMQALEHKGSLQAGAFLEEVYMLGASVNLCDSIPWECADADVVVRGSISANPCLARNQNANIWKPYVEVPKPINELATPLHSQEGFRNSGTVRVMIVIAAKSALRYCSMNALNHLYIIQQ